MEACLQDQCSLEYEEVNSLVLQFLESMDGNQLSEGVISPAFYAQCSVLQENVEYLKLCRVGPNGG